MFPDRRKMIIIHVIIMDFPTFSYKPKFIGREKSVWQSASLAGVTIIYPYHLQGRVTRTIRNNI